MTSRFGNLKFNLMRAIELFQDMNHEDMDVYAPLSSDDCFKELEVAKRLNNCLNQMIEEGVFDNCDYRAPATDTESLDSRSESQSEPSDRGYGESSDGTNSRESFTRRFRRYIRRIMPGGRGSYPTNSEASESSDDDNDVDEDIDDEEEMVSGSPSQSASLSYSLRDNGSRHSSFCRTSRSPVSRSNSQNSSRIHSRSSSGSGSLSRRQNTSRRSSSSRSSRPLRR